MVKNSIERVAKNLFLPLCFSLTGLALASCEANSPDPQESSTGIVPESVNPDTVTEIVKIFEDLNICLADVRDNGTELPRVYLETLPNDMHKHKEVHLSKRQEVFILSVLPLILKVNEEIEADREYLLFLDRTNQAFSNRQKERLRSIAEKYNLQTTDVPQMLTHIDIIPPSLALAQTCLETGWGSSSAARVKNSLFGMTISGNVKKYNSLAECTWEYMRNLNYNPAYKKFRTLRAEMRSGKKPFDSVKLSESLTAYCEFTKSYLRDLKIILNDYSLSDFDQVALAKSKSLFG
jgi:Bax protein